MNQRNQQDDIINYLDHHPEGITTMEAFSKLRITKLSTRVGEINASGRYPIVNIWESHKAEDGSVSRYKRYFKKVV